LHYGAQRLGRFGIVGLTLCVFSLITIASTNIPMRQQLALQSAELDSARAEAAEARRPGTIQSPQQQATSFVSKLPTRNNVPEIMATIVSVATASGIKLERGSYEYIATDTDTIARYEMSLPVTGSYPQVKEFVENVLATVPSIALDSMRIERGDIADSVIAADLKFSILLGGAA
jgi:Tfp pilus assembly protein PilO